MRLFATGAMNWVMGKAFPDDVPLEAKMVTKAIERAQRTVEDRNFEIRKDVLKYDEVMNEQRKVIYRRRQQILDGGDLRDEAYEAIDERDRPRRARELRRASSPRTGTSTSCTSRCHASIPTRDHARAARRAARTATMLVELFTDDAVEQYEAKEATIGADNAPRDRAPRDALDDRPALARAPLRDGLPARGHQPPRDGPEGPARRVAARGLRHVRGDDGPDPGRLRRLRLAPPGRGGRGGAAGAGDRDACATARPRTRCRARARMRATAAAMPAEELAGEFGDAGRTRGGRRRARDA